MVLADDEPIITKGIKMLLDWERLGIRVTETYEDGQKALHGILANEPDIAILDIAMPGKSGVEVLQEIKLAKCKTMVIFLSGFQDFEYARAAIRYGAIDYLLKPVKKESLLLTISKCAELSENRSSPAPNSESMPCHAFKKLVDDKPSSYIFALGKIIGRNYQNDMEAQLTRFTVFSAIEEIVEAKGLGIAFQKSDKFCLVLKDVDSQAAKRHLTYIQGDLEAAFGVKAGFVIGAPFFDLKKATDSFSDFSEKMGFFYFSNELESLVLEASEPPFKDSVTDQDVRKLRDDLITALVRLDNQEAERLAEQYLRAVCVLSGSRSDTAVYHILSCARMIDERFDTHSLLAPVIEEAFDAPGYAELSSLFRELVQGLEGRLSTLMQSEDKKVAILAKRYIDEHYAENITLKTMAAQIHMNPYYFSAYFKKQTGQNFKDYLSQARMERAMELLVQTGKRSYEIADDVGFKDYRHFSDLFCKRYGMTPAAYRKHMKGTD
ncbi:MAG: response regulator [Clostridiales bacterium]|jgi:two-component system response regulator YesN|nr:response regulator [Clostridiales bacterium]